eukprot:CAMPEP_0194090500 /NCGR_PEP_ID=MMETSP0149-20130528/39291_1 /TAXON_ID=122233 /ORGANISM="Chaetoceros debilis, Strain MM31A-1" /LENGTH=72 /DNA_ID=CAMNT_0038774773 /DNA_START=295 /DNA_END=513 /DNA_ORIENTATION=-
MGGSDLCHGKGDVYYNPRMNMSSNAISSDPDATRRQVDASSDEDLRTDDEDEDENEEMASDICVTANDNGKC